MRVRRDVLLLPEGDYEELRRRLEATIQTIDPIARVRDLSGYSYEYMSPQEAVDREACTARWLSYVATPTPR
jgi:hypothetical protein